MAQTFNSATTEGQSGGSGKALNIILWILQVAAAALFLMAGFSKLAGVPQTVAVFQTIGMGQWFRYLTGALEVIGAIALLIPRLSGIGALLLVFVMLGAIMTHLFIIGGNPLGAIVCLVVTAIIAWGRRRRIMLK
jgi:uncharacterized membrane protein YphA (DoxX/SURF4 family)